MGVASVLAEVRVSFWCVGVTWSGLARRKFLCGELLAIVHRFRAAATSLPGALICILGGALGSLRPIVQLFQR